MSNVQEFQSWVQPEIDLVEEQEVVEEQWDREYEEEAYAHCDEQWRGIHHHHNRRARW